MLPFQAMRVKSPTGGGGSTYLDVGEFGNHVAVTGDYNLGSNFKSVITVTVPDGGSGGVWVKTLHILMRTAVLGNTLKPVLYSGVISSSTLVATGQEYVIPASFTGVDTEVTINWNVAAAPLFISAGTLSLGLITVTGDCRRSSGTTYWNADTYSDGPASPFGTVSSSGSQMIVWCPYSNTGP